jgi:hypothetical protein
MLTNRFSLSGEVNGKNNTGAAIVFVGYVYTF